MGMFLNYHNISDNYKPNNLINAFPLVPSFSKLNPTDISKPYEEYDSKGNLIGYFWRQGETLNLEFNIDGEITVESNAIIIRTTGVQPTQKTMAKVGQRAYNVVDFKSWTCISTLNGIYVWKQDTEFTYPTNTNRSIYIPASDYLKDKTVEITLYNFRMEPICSRTYPGHTTIIFAIDKELSRKIPKGIYYCSATVSSKDVCYKIFDSTDCTLLVK